MNQRFLTVLLLLISFIFSQGRGLPTFIYGPEAESYFQQADSIIIKNLKMGKRLSDDLIIDSGEDKTFILICEETLIELLPGTKIIVDRSDKYIRVIEGNIVIHSEDEITSFCYSVLIESGAIGYIGTGKIKLTINYSDHVLHNGIFYPQTDYLMVDNDFIKESRRDGNYILSLIYQSDLPALQKEFYLPSKRDRNFKFSTKEKTGTASYLSDTYYHAGSYLKLRMNEFEFVYNLYIALSLTDGFYTGNWDEWQDIINNIHYLQIFHPSDPLYFRVGMIEKLEFGRGYIVDNYNNTVILPFESLSGVRIKAGNRNFLSHLFINDLTKPRVGGIYFNKRFSKRFYVDMSYIGDFNQYSNILDSDGDSYPDKIDRQDNIKNIPNETVIVDGDTVNTKDWISLDDLDDSQLHAIGLGVKVQIGNISATDIFVTGDFGFLTTPGLGISFPNLYFGNSLFEFGIGANFQSPNFIPSVFDRRYEYNKARFKKNAEGEYNLISRAKAIDEDEEDWFSGWNTFFNLNIAKRLTLKTRFREIHSTNDDVKKHVTFSVKSRYSFSEYLKSYSFFIDHKDIEELFKEKTDGAYFGFKIYLLPHEAIDVDIRYRQRYIDRNDDGEIKGDDIDRNFALNIVLDTEYWWKKYKNRKKK